MLTPEALEETTACKHVSILEQLTNELHQLQQDFLQYKDFANQYEMARLRTEAHLKKTKGALREKQMETVGLKEGMESLAGRKKELTGKEQFMNELYQTQQDVLYYKDKENQYEIAVLRTDLVSFDEDACSGDWKQHQSSIHNKRVSHDSIDFWICKISSVSRFAVPMKNQAMAVKLSYISRKSLPNVFLIL